MAPQISLGGQGIYLLLIGVGGVFFPLQVSEATHTPLIVLVLIGAAIWVGLGGLSLWAFYASEWLGVTESYIVLRRRVGRIGTRHYLWLSRISNLDAIDETTSGVGVWTVGFDYDGKRQYFGRDISEEEARWIVERLQPYIAAG